MTHAFAEESVEDVMKELRIFTIPYDSICLVRKDESALDARVRLSQTNPKALSRVAEYWYGRAIKSNPEKWLRMVQDAQDESELKKSVGVFLVNFYSDHMEEIKATIGLEIHTAIPNSAPSSQTPPSSPR